MATPRSRDMEMIRQWVACMSVMVEIIPLVRAMAEAERIAPGYGALATIQRWTMIQAGLMIG
jgi:hypothetical protein